MLELLIVVLVVLWALGFFAVHIGGALVHLLLAVAVILFLVRLFRPPAVIVDRPTRTTIIEE
jgi:hypothetical protein